MRLVIGKYFGYNIGGAEKSTQRYFESRGLKYEFIFFTNLRHYDAQSKITGLNNAVNVKLYFDWKYFPFTEALVNLLLLRQKLKSIVRDRQITEIYFYGFYGVFSIIFPETKNVLFIRDEYGNGKFPNYHKGIQKYIYNIYSLLECLPRKIWRKIVLRSSFSEVIHNSKYSLNNSLIGPEKSELTLLYPEINKEELLAMYNMFGANRSKLYVTLIGDKKVKGIEIFLFLVESFPDVEFLLIGSISRTYKNVLCIPYLEIGKILAMTKILLVPSQWQESYGRVVKEAAICNIPTLASHIGGIPEAAGPSTVLVTNFSDLNIWREQLDLILRKNGT